MKSIGGVKSENGVSSKTSEEVKAEQEKIDFSNVKIEPLFEEEVDFDTFSKSDFRAVKVKECVAVPKSRSCYSLHLMMEQAQTVQSLAESMLSMSQKNLLERHLSLSQTFHQER